MNEEEIKKFDRHIGKPGILEIDGDTFELQPLGFEYITDFLMIGKNFATLPKDSPPEKFIEILNEDTISRMKKIVLETLKKSYPAIPEDKLVGFASKYFIEIFVKTFEINGLGEGKATKIEEMKKRIENATG